MYNNHPILNHVPLEPGLGSHPILGPGGNNITMRGNQIQEQFPTAKRFSRNMAEASLRTLRFYRKVCRLMPFVLRIHNLNHRVDETQGMLNVANIIRRHAHLRDPVATDAYVLLNIQRNRCKKATSF
jgi:hypothetical protein